MTCTRANTTTVEMNTKIAQIADLGSADGFRTIRLGDGRWVSVTGDTCRPGETLPAFGNSMVVWDSCGQYRVGPDGDFFPRWADDSRFWPAQPCMYGTTMVVMGSRTLVAGAGSWTPMGAYGAIVNIPACGTPTFSRYFATPSSLTDDTYVQWYSGLGRDSTYWYIHGVLDRPDQFHARDAGFCARAPLTSIENLATWSYWNGTAWVTAATAAIPTIPCVGVGGSESGYTLHKRPNGMWTVTTKKGGTLANDLGRYNAVNPWGPTWTWEFLMTIGGTDKYLAGAAPAVPCTAGKVLVEWSRSGTYPQWAEVAQ